MPLRPHVRYRRDLTPKAQALRRDPTPAERKLWFEFLSTHSLKFTRQKPLGRYIADFYCARLLLIIEVDGDSHFTAVGMRRDRSRTESLELQGMRILRFTNADVMERFEAVCDAIERAVNE